MIIYKGVKAFYLGLKRWRVNCGGWAFDIFCKAGIHELKEDIDRWQRE